MELWKKVDGWGGRYEVSNLGVIRRSDLPSTSGFRKPQIDQHGYQFVNLCLGGFKQRKFIHRLVALAFIPNPLNKPFVNHKDGNPLNNSVDNLEWCTSGENQSHSYRVLGRQSGGRMFGRVIVNGIEYSSINQAAVKIGVHYSTIRRRCRNKRLTTYTYLPSLLDLDSL